MTTHEVHSILAADARRWPDHTDYWRHGPTLSALTLPATLPRADDRLRAALFQVTNDAAWRAAFGPLHAY